MKRALREANADSSIIAWILLQLDIDFLKRFRSMAPSLKILHPTGDPPYPPTEPVRVNSTTPVQIRTSGFLGEISVWVKDYHGLKKKGDGMEYFGEKGREGMTYGIVVRGEHDRS